jgi:hypothetical protein
MPTPLRVPTALRFLAPALLLALVFLLSPVALFGQAHTTGLAVTKSCPPTADPGTSIPCTFSITNQDTQHGVITLAVTNQVPLPGGPITPVDCTQGGSPVTTLGVNGTATDTCTGAATETAPACTGSSQFFTDQISATGEDEGVTGLPVSGAASNSVLIPACTPTPTPTNTPTPTPTNTPTTVDTSTPTNTPTTSQAPPPDVPTLSFPMMALLGLILAGAGLFLTRRA